jgi:SAM-dependent methyltransferase
MTREPESMCTCRICGNSKGNKKFIAREMMFGWRDCFEYFKCGYCGCLQISEVPNDLSKYYPANYYSFSFKRDNWAKRVLKRARARQALGFQTLGGRFLLKVWGIPDFVEWLKPVHVGFCDAILDVGSGAGALLLEMHNAGFRNVTGMDPYIVRDLELIDGVRVLKRRLSEVDGPYDFVMLAHSFEHMADPRGILEQIARLLPSGHYVMIGMPVAGTYAWRKYKTDWVELDAPRHLFLHTEKSIRCLAAQACFELEKVHYYSDEFQFWGSEQYQCGIPLRDERSYAVNRRCSMFSSADIRRFRAMAKSLNEQSDGDRALFYLRRL